MRKIFIKHIQQISFKKNILDNLKSNYAFKTIIEHIILSSDGYHKYINNELYKYSLEHEFLYETDYFCEFMEYQKKQYKVMQIPTHHKLIIKKTIIFKISKECSLAFEIIDNKIHDFYITSTINLHITDFILNKELSYIKDLII
jgi:hypothetical protein